MYLEGGRGPRPPPSNPRLVNGQEGVIVLESQQKDFLFHDYQNNIQFNFPYFLVLGVNVVLVYPTVM